MAKSKVNLPDEMPEELPEEVANVIRRRAEGDTSPIKLDEIFRGAEWSSAVKDLNNTGVHAFRDKSGQERFLAADVDGEGNVMNIAAALPRQPGKSIDFLKSIEDFKDALSATKQGRKDAVELFSKIYRAEGTVNNAVQKLVGLIAPQGRFKVQGIRGQRGKSATAVAKEAEALCNWWKDAVNGRPENAVMTGDQGTTAFIRRGARIAFVEGDHIARHIWTKGTKVPTLKNKPFTLPMNLQTISARHIEIPEGLEGTDYELLYWVPPKKFIQQLQKATDPNVQKSLDKMVPPKVKAELVKTGKYLLDQNLLIHIKHRGTGTEAFGESLVEPAVSDIRYKRALDALELTTITNLINRLVIVKVGSDNEKSVYHKSTVSASRLGLLQRIMAQAGPAATVLWGGPDIDVVEVSAHNSILELDGRYKIAERRILMALGVPVVLLMGEGNDGKAAGIAAALGIVAQLRELQDQYVAVMVRLAQRILEQNKFNDVNITFEITENLLENKEAAANLILKMFQMGLLSTETSLEETGFDFSAEEARQIADVEAGYKSKAFGPPLAMQKNPTGAGGEGGGRPTKEENPEKDPREGKETVSPEENK